MCWSVLTHCFTEVSTLILNSFMTFPVRFALLTRVRQCFPAPSGASSWWHSSLVLCACTAPQEAPRILPPKASWTLFTTSSLGSLRKAKESFQTYRSCQVTSALKALYLHSSVLKGRLHILKMALHGTALSTACFFCSYPKSILYTEPNVFTTFAVVVLGQ